MAPRKACLISALFGNVMDLHPLMPFGYIMQSLLDLISAIIQLYTFIIIGQVIVSWLVSFNVINMTNQFVYMVSNTLYRATEPALQPIRRFIPNLGGLDVSPVILLLLLYFVQNLLHEYWPQGGI
jgi:YggT family protein